MRIVPYIRILLCIFFIDSYSMHRILEEYKPGTCTIFQLPIELIEQIIAYCEPCTKNKLMHTNHFFNYRASQENSRKILLLSPVLLSRKNQTDYVTSCITEDNAPLLKNLLHHGASLYETTMVGLSPFRLAIIKNSINSVKFLIEETPVDVNERAGDRSFPLYFAAQENYIEIVKLLLKHPKINATNTFNYGFTACYVAAQKGNLSIIKLLLDYDDTLLNMSCIDGSTPLYLAAQENQVEVIKFLLTRDALDINARYKKAYTPLYIATQRNHDAVVRLLLTCKDIEVDT
jgi:ankyrin repeat protein